MVLVIHTLVSGPTARLLNRVQRLRKGQEVPSLSVDLRGEALALGRQFEEVLAKVEKLSQTDSLTALRNRRSFQQVLQSEFRRCRRYNRVMALMMLDLDFLKATNDALGHQAGDQIIKTFAQIITDSVRATDAVGRLGGDEFAVLMPESSSADVLAVAQRICQELAGRSVGRGELQMTLTASVGIADVNDPAVDSPETLVDQADKALYAAKRGGRNRCVRSDQMPDPNGLETLQDHNRVDNLCKQLAGLDAKFKRLFVDALGGLISALEARDEHTANHSAKVRRYAMMIARKMSLPQRTVEHVGRAAMLHDIGKIGLPDNVLRKASSLTKQEWELVRRHPIMSVRILEGMEFLDQEIPAVRYHHERFDGGGYPEGLAGSSIPLAARILAVADAFDAMVSSRVYRDGMGVAAALEEIRGNSGTQFDPAVVEAFFQVVQEEKINDQTLAAQPAEPPAKLSA
jgi:diguanylate cyclase (GGDEF)-like protein